MKVLVTGAAGMLGRALVPTLAGHCEVVGVDLPDGDLAEPAVAGALCARHRPDWCVHAAAFTDVAVYIGDGATLTRNMIRRHRESGELFGHATVRQQLGWCAEEGVGRMIVTHCGSDIVAGDARRVEETVQVMAAERGIEVEIAHDGLERVLR